MSRQSAAILLCLTFSSANALAQNRPARKDEPKDPLARLVVDMIGTMKDATRVLKELKSKDQVEQAKKDLGKVMEQMNEINKRWANLGQPSKDQEAELDRKYKQAIDDAFNDFQSEVQRLQKTDYGKDVIALLKPKTGSR
jgi:hypothetical protein